MFTYLAGLLVAIAGLLVLDWRFRLAFWRDARRTALTLATSVALFVLWDILGIALGIFLHGHSPLALPPLVSEFPIEEILFLILLCYSALMLYLGVRRWRHM